MIEVLTLGHSFISRFYNYLAISGQANICLSYIDVYLNDTPGGNICRVRYKGLPKRTAYAHCVKQDIVVLQIGSYDLCKEKRVEDAVQELNKMVVSLKEFNVPQIIFMQVLFSG